MALACCTPQPTAFVAAALCSHCSSLACYSQIIVVEDREEYIAALPVGTAAQLKVGRRQQQVLHHR